MNETTTVATSVGIDPENPDDSSVALCVVEAVAEAKGTSVMAIEQPLYDAIDPEALDRFVAAMDATDAGATGQIDFTYAGYEITVFGDGTVSVLDGGRETDRSE